MSENVLSSVKKFIGVGPNDDSFDTDLVILINSEFGTLNQLHVGPTEPFRILTKEETWEEFIEDKKYLEMAKEFVCLNVKMIFDPPQNSFIMDAYKEKTRELEWRLNMFDNVETVQDVIDAWPENSRLTDDVD